MCKMCGDEMLLEDFRVFISKDVSEEIISTRVMNVLHRVCLLKLPASFDAGLSLDRFLAFTPTRLIYQNRLVIRNGLKGHQVREALGVSKGSFRVYRTYLKKFMDQVEKNFRPQRAPNEPDLSAIWLNLVEKVRLLEKPKTRLKITAMKRFACFCEERNREPEAVDASMVKGFRDYLRDESGIQSAPAYYRCLKGVWEGLVLQGELPEVMFALWDENKSLYGLRWDALPDVPAGVFKDFERLANAEDPDERIGKDSLCASTLTTYQAIYLDYMGYLANVAGVALSQVSETELFSRKHLEGFHRFALSRSGGKAMQWHMRRIFFFRRLIKRVVIPLYGDVETEWMDVLISKTTAHEKDQHAPEYLREQVDQVLHHIDVNLAHCGEAKFGKLIPLHTARFAITFLADHPLRGINLRGAHLGRDFSDDGRSFRLRTKNRQIIETKLSQDSWVALQAYLAVRKRAGIYSTAVLVSRKGRAMSQSGFYNIIVNNFARGAGMHFTPHCFRYLAAGQALERTGDVNYAGAAIGDRSGRVVEKSYNRYSANQAGCVWFELNEAFRNDGIEALPPPLQKLIERAKLDDQLATRLKAALCEEGENHVKQA